MDHRYRALLVVICISVSGCSAFGNHNAAEKANVTPLPSEGTIVLSTGAASRCIFGPSTELNIENANHDVVAGVDVDNYVIKSDFDDHQGNVSVLTLPAGNYRIYPVALGPFLRPINTPFGEFNVVAGRAEYIGEYYMSVACQNTTYATFRDRGDRDLSFVRQRNAAFSQVVFEKQLARFGGYMVYNGKRQ